MAARYTQEQLANARLMVERANRENIDPRLPIIAALTESNLTNIQGGDRDSVGLFQMRQGIWNQGPYRGYATDVNKQLDWFFDTAKKADRGRNLGEWAANIERPAAQYRGRYAQRMSDAEAILAQLGQGGGGGVGSTTLSQPAPASVAGTTAATAITADRGSALRRELLGNLMAGNDPRQGLSNSLSTLAVLSRARRSQGVKGIPQPTPTAQQNPSAEPGTILGGEWQIGGGPNDHAARAFGNWQSDNAYDLLAPVGTPVYAVSDGVVDERFGSLGTSGKTAGYRLTVNSPDNRFFYHHLSGYAPGIKPGTQVRRGDLIGYSGEAVGVPHLHFGVERGDPAAYFRRPGGKKK